MGTRNNSFSAKVKVDIQAGTLYEKTSKEENLYSIDKVLDAFSGTMKLTLSDLTADQVRQILAIVHGNETPMTFNISQSDTLEELMINPDEEDVE